MRTRLEAKNIQNYRERFVSGRAPEASINWDGSNSSDFKMNELYYRFPVGKARVYVGTHGLDPSDVAGTVIGPDAALLDHFEYNTLAYDLDGQGAGVGARMPLGPVEFSAGYYADTGESAAAGASRGFFSGSNSFAGQVAFNPTDNISVVGSYTRFYSPENSDDIEGNAYGVSAATTIGSRVSLSGWAGWADAEHISDGKDGDTFIWAATLGFPDLFREGNYGGISVGGADSDDVSPLGVDSDFMAEALYKFKVSDNVSIQPSVAYIEELSNGSDESAWLANVRTTFKF